MNNTHQSSDFNPWSPQVELGELGEGEPLPLDAMGGRTLIVVLVISILAWFEAAATSNRGTSVKQIQAVQTQSNRDDAEATVWGRS